MDNIFAPTEKRVLSAHKAFVRQDTKCFSTVVSLFNRITHGVCDARIPALTAAEKPRFSGKQISRTLGKCCRISSTLPSVEPLSTTMMGKGLFSQAYSEDRQFCKYSLPFKLGIITVVLIVFFFSSVSIAAPCHFINGSHSIRYPMPATSLPKRSAAASGCVSSFLILSSRGSNSSRTLQQRKSTAATSCCRTARCI